MCNKSSRPPAVHWGKFKRWPSSATQMHDSVNMSEGKKNKNPDDVYFVNREGEEVVNVLDEEGNTTDEWVKVGLKERQPFLDDDDKPILSDSAPKKEETKATSKPKRKRKSTTSEKDAETT